MKATIARPIPRQKLYKLIRHLQREKTKYRQAIIEEEDLYARNRYEGMMNAYRLCGQAVEDILRD